MTAPVIYHSGGDVIMSGFGRLDSDALDYLCAVTGDEFYAALFAGDNAAMTTAQRQGHALLTARIEANRWAKASGVRA